MSEIVINDQHKIEELQVQHLPAAKFAIQNSGPANQSCRIVARNDWEALQDWLQEHTENAGTYRIYKREVVRFFLWCRHKTGVTFAELSKDHLNAYLKFLKSPDKSWCASREQIRNGKWKPFVGPLGLAAYRTAVQVLNSFLQYLTDASYLNFNPLKLINLSKTPAVDHDRHKYKVWERILEDDEWQAIQQALLAMPETGKEAIDNKERTKFLIALLYLLGLRISEVANSTWGAFRKRQDEWWFFVEGKGGKLGHIPVNAQLLNCVKGYRLHLGKTLLPKLDETEHLLVSQKTNKALGVRQLRDLVKSLGTLAAKQFPAQSLKQQKLAKFSPHWLRHLSASHQDRAGVPFSMIKANHRHSSTQTTQIYIHADDQDRFSEMQKIGMNLPITTGTVKPQNLELQITIKPNPMNSEFAFSKLLAAIETQVLKNLTCNRSGDLELVEFNFGAYSRVSKPIVFVYSISSQLAVDKVVQIKQDILQEADIRHFNCYIATTWVT